MQTATTRQRAMHNTAPDHERAFANKLMQMLAIPAFVIDTGCKVMIWNRACERLTGVAVSKCWARRTTGAAFTTRRGRSWPTW